MNNTENEYGIKIYEVEQGIKNDFESNAICYEGDLERMKEKIDKLENAIAHLIAFITIKFNLSPDEIWSENGITDF